MNRKSRNKPTFIHLISDKDIKAIFQKKKENKFSGATTTENSCLKKRSPSCHIRSIKEEQTIDICNNVDEYQNIQYVQKYIIY